MTSQISKFFVLFFVCVFFFCTVNAQDQKQQLLNGIAMQERLATMQPDSVGPIYQQALLSLNYSVIYPQDKQTTGLLDKAKTLIDKLDKMKAADRSDVFTLRGFYYECLIVQDPMKNGARYYQEVISNLDEALRLNPDNQFAKMLYQKFQEGMKSATK